jgi:hypothetical protein
MIRAREPQTFVIETPPTTEEERARNLAMVADFERNVAWWNSHVVEIREKHTGKFVCVSGQELFVGDDPTEVMTRAETAYPGGGHLSLFLSPHRGPKIYANQRNLAGIRRPITTTGVNRRS